MAAEMHLSVVAPDRSVVEEPVASLILPGLGGYLGVMPGHEPLVAALKPGVLEYADKANNRHFVSITGGFAEISGTQVTVLADAAERSTDIDLARAEKSLEEARHALKGEPASMGLEEAVAQIERATARIRTAKSV